MSLGELRVQYKRARIRRTNGLQKFVEETVQEGTGVTLVSARETIDSYQNRVGERSGAQFDQRMMAIAPHFPTMPEYANRIEGASAALGSASAPADYYRMPPRDIVADTIGTDENGELKALSPGDTQRIFALGYTPYVCDAVAHGHTAQGNSDNAPEIQACELGNVATKPRVADEVLRTSCASMRETGTLLSPAAIAARRSMYVYTGLTLDAQNRCDVNSALTDSYQKIGSVATTGTTANFLRCDHPPASVTDTSKSHATLYDIRGTLPVENVAADDQYQAFRIPARRINVRPMRTGSSTCGDRPDYFESADSMCDPTEMLDYRVGGESSIAVITTEVHLDRSAKRCATPEYVSHAVLQHHDVVNYGMEVVFTDRMALTSGVVHSTSEWYDNGVIDNCRVDATGTAPFIDSGPVLTTKDATGEYLYPETTPGDTAWQTQWQHGSWSHADVTPQGGRRWGRMSKVGSHDTAKVKDDTAALYNPVFYIYGISTSRGRAQLRRESYGDARSEVHYRRYRPYMVINSQGAIDWGSAMKRSSGAGTVLTRWLRDASRAPVDGASPYGINLASDANQILEEVNAMPDENRDTASRWVLSVVEGSLMRPVRAGGRTTTYAGDNMQTGRGQVYSEIWQNYSEIIRRGNMLAPNQMPATCPCLEGSLIAADPVCDCVAAIFAAGAVDHETRVPLAMHAWSGSDVGWGGVPRGFYRTCQGGSRGRVYGFPNQGVPVMNSTVCNTINTMVGNDASRIAIENMGSTVCNGAVAATANATPVWLFGVAIGAIVIIAAVVIVRR